MRGACAAQVCSLEVVSPTCPRRATIGSAGGVSPVDLSLQRSRQLEARRGIPRHEPLHSARLPAPQNSSLALGGWHGASLTSRRDGTLQERDCAPRLKIPEESFSLQSSRNIRRVACGTH